MIKRSFNHVLVYKRYYFFCLFLIGFITLVVLTKTLIQESRRFVYREMDYVVSLSGVRLNELIGVTEQLLSFNSKHVDLLNSSKEDCDRFMVDLLAAYPLFTNFAVVDVNGEARCTGLPQATNVNVAYRPYMQQVLRDKKFTVGQFQIGNSSGKPVLPLAFPLFDGSNEMKAVFVTYIDLDEINRLNKELNPPNRMVIYFIDSNGLVLDSIPKNEHIIRTKVNDSEMFKNLLAQNGKGHGYYRGIESRKELYSFVPLVKSSSDYQVYSVMGLSHSMLMQLVLSAFAKTIITLVLGLFALGVTVYLWRIFLNTRSSNHRQN